MIKIKPYPTQKELRDVLIYESETGDFYWKWRSELSDAANRMAGKKAGYKNSGHYTIGYNGIYYLAHRLAWIFVYGDIADPSVQIDHRDNNPYNNKIENLRLASHAENTRNARKWKKKKLPKGVSQQSKGVGYLSRINFNGKSICLGTFKTPDDANKAYCEASKRLHGEFSRVA